MQAEGLLQKEKYRKLGFTEEEIADWEGKERQKYTNLGFSLKETNDYFGVKEPDMALTKAFFDKQVSDWAAQQNSSEAVPANPAVKMQDALGVVQGNSATETAPAAPGVQPQLPPKKATNWVEAFVGGLENTAPAMLIRGKESEYALDQEASLPMRLSSAAGQFVGDSPLAAMGFAGGSVVGGPILGLAGANTLPEALRTALMDHYQKGDIQNFKDFWDRAVNVAMQSSKAFATGIAAGTAGKIAGKELAKASVPFLSEVGNEVYKTTSRLAAEAATLTEVGHRLNGSVPDAKDFAESGIFIAGVHGIAYGGSKVAQKLRSIYAEKGLEPYQVAQHADQEATVKQDLLSENIDMPKAYEGLGQNAQAMTVQPSELTGIKQIDLPEQVLKNTETLTGEESFSPPVDPRAELPYEIKRPSLEQANKEISQFVREPGKPLTSEQANQEVSNFIQEPTVPKEKFDFNKFYTDNVDKLHPINRVVSYLSEKVNGVKPDENPYVLSRLLAGNFGQATDVVKNGPVKWANNERTGTPSLEKILEPHAKAGDVQNFENYMVASRALELYKRGIEKVGVSKEAAQEVVKAGKAKYESSFRQFVDYQNDVLSYLKDSGVLSKEAFDNIKEMNKDFVSFQRISDPEGTAGKSAGGSLRQPIQKITGSENAIQSPIVSAVQNTHLYMAMAERNYVANKFIDLIKKAGPEGEKFAVKEKTSMKPIQVSSPEVASFLKENGIDPAQLKDSDGFSIFRPLNKQLANDEIVRFVDGKKEVWKVSPAVAEAFNGTDSVSHGLWFTVAKGLANALRTGIILTPDYMVRNFTRDQIATYNVSKYGYLPLWSAAKGLEAILKNTPEYQEWLQSGGANATFVRIDSDYIKRNIYDISKETGLLSKTWGTVKNAKDLLYVLKKVGSESVTMAPEKLRELSELVENSTRVGHYIEARNSGASPIESAFASRDTLDFARIGAKRSAINSISAFWNGKIQGLDKSIRAVSEDPQGFASRIASSVMAPSIALWWANHDDPRWKTHVHDWEKDAYWIVFTKDNIFKIPKPQELGILFGSLPERMLEAFFEKNPKAWKHFNDTMIDQFFTQLLPTPTALTPLVEQFANKSILTGAPIVPSYLQGGTPEYMYTPYTTETAKYLGRILGYIPGGQSRMGNSPPLAAPVVVENYIRAWTGSSGMWALKLADEALSAAGVTSPPPKPLTTLADIPFIKSFVIRYPSASPQVLQDFYERAALKQQTVIDVKNAASRGDVKAIQQELVDRGNAPKLIKLDAVMGSINKLRRVVELVNVNPKMTPNDKTQIIDTAYYQMTQLGVEGNKILDEIDKAVEKQQK